MELLTVAEHRQIYSNGGMKQISDAFSSPPRRTVAGINCWDYESRRGILPLPSSDFIIFGSPQATVLLSQSVPLKKPRRSNPITIRSRLTEKFTFQNEKYSGSERWAGPAYSNSPPPSSLPKPNFPLFQPSGSLESFCPLSPCSHERQFKLSSSVSLGRTDMATQNLRRMLNLDHC